MDWQAVLTQVQRLGFEYVFKRFPGLYRATVTDVDDPERRGRIRALVPSIGARTPSAAWFDPVSVQAGAARGFFAPPNVGDSVFVAFENGDPSRPLLYVGGWYGSPSGRTEVPVELGYDSSSPPRPKRFGWVTRLGHALLFDETADQEYVELRWHQPAAGDASRTDRSKAADRTRGKTSSLKFAADGGVTLRNPAGSQIVLDAAGQKVVLQDESGNRITMSSGGIVVQAKSGGSVRVEADTVVVKANAVSIGEPASNRSVLGEPLMAYLATHTHGSAVGPTGVPLQPPDDTLLSRTVKIKP